MNNKNILQEKLKELFALSKKMSFFDAKLKDGSIVRTEDAAIAKGSKVVLIGVDGVQSDIADGDYTSEDGSTLNVKSGVVEAILPASEVKADEKMDASTTTDATSTPTPAADAVAPATEGEGELGQLMEIIKNLVDRVAALETSGADTKMTVEKMSAIPAAKPVGYTPMDNYSIGSVLEKFKSDKKAKELKREAALTEVMSKGRSQNFSSQSNSNEGFSLNLGGFSVESGK